MSLSNGKRSRVPVPCLRCGNIKFHEARGLCKCCYNHLAEGRCRTGEYLDSYPRTGGYGRAAFALESGVDKAHQLRRVLDPGHIGAREARREAIR